MIWEQDGILTVTIVTLRKGDERVWSESFAWVWEGSSNHTKEKVIFDGSIVYRNDDLRQVYHQRFDESLEAFNEKQTRAERKIPDYFDKICNSRQEKAIPRIDCAYWKSKRYHIGQWIWEIDR